MDTDMVMVRSAQKTIERQGENQAKQHVTCYQQFDFELLTGTENIL